MQVRGVQERVRTKSRSGRIARSEPVQRRRKPDPLEGVEYRTPVPPQDLGADDWEKLWIDLGGEG
jgi:hypothetical protein